MVLWRNLSWLSQIFDFLAAEGTAKITLNSTLNLLVDLT